MIKNKFEATSEMCYNKKVGEIVEVAVAAPQSQGFFLFPLEEESFVVGELLLDKKKTKNQKISQKNKNKNSKTT